MPLKDDGIVTVCNLINTSSSGMMPVYELDELYTQCYEERSISMNRAYLARGVDEQIDMVIRIDSDGQRPKIGQYALLQYYDGQEEEQGDQYRITLVQPVSDDHGLKAYDLTLSRLEKNYDATIR